MNNTPDKKKQIDLSFKLIVPGLLFLFLFFPVIIQKVMPSREPLWLFILLTGGPLQLVSICCAGIAWRRHNQTSSLADAFDLRKISIEQLLKCGGITLLLYPVISIVTEFFSKLLTWLHLPVYPHPLLYMLRNGEAPEIIIAVFIAVILTPIGEELTYRFVFLQKFQEWLPERTAGILLSVLFAAIHFNLAQFPGLLLLGFWFLRCYKENKSLYAPIAAHAIFNATSLFLFFWFR